MALKISATLTKTPKVGFVQTNLNHPNDTTFQDTFMHEKASWKARENLNKILSLEVSRTKKPENFVTKKKYASI